MSKGFKTNITFIRWMVGLKDQPFELIDAGNIKASLNLAAFNAHQYALLDAYPGSNKDLEKKSNYSVRGRVDYGDEDDGSSDSGRYGSASRSSSTDDLPTIDAQIQHTQLTWSPSSAIDYLVNRAYYALALKCMEQNASALWTLPLGLAWALYRLVDALRFVGALIFSPIGFALTFTLKNSWAAARLLGTRVHHEFANVVNWFSLQLADYHYYENARLRDKNGNLGFHYPSGKPVYKRILKPNIHFTEAQILNASVVLPPPSLDDASATFKKRWAENWEACIAYFTPVREKLEPILNPLFEKAKDKHPGWVVASILTVASLLAIVAFMDFVAVKVLMRAIENRPFGTSFLDQIGGGYAKTTASHISDWATIAWDNIQIGMQFFIHFLVNKAIVPGLNLIPGLDIAHTSPETCRFVGGIVFMTLMPLLTVLGAYRKWMAKTLSSSARERLTPDSPSPSRHPAAAARSTSPAPEANTSWLPGWDCLWLFCRTHSNPQPGVTSPHEYIQPQGGQSPR